MRESHNREQDSCVRQSSIGMESPDGKADERCVEGDTDSVFACSLGAEVLGHSFPISRV